MNDFHIYIKQTHFFTQINHSVVHIKISQSLKLCTYISSHSEAKKKSKCRNNKNNIFLSVWRCQMTQRMIETFAYFVLHVTGRFMQTVPVKSEIFTVGGNLFGKIMLGSVTHIDPNMIKRSLLRSHLHYTLCLMYADCNFMWLQLLYNVKANGKQGSAQNEDQDVTASYEPARCKSLCKLFFTQFP